jgi:hypothetical protein
LLRFMLSSHPCLYLPDETGFLPFLDTGPQVELSRGAVQDLLGDIGDLNRFWHGLVVDHETFYASLTRPTLPFVLDALYRRQIEPHVPARWGDKTPLYVRYIPEIQTIFPEAQFIHVLRDGRDAALSARAKWGQDRPYMDLSYLLRNWVRNVQAGRAAGDRLGPQQYYEVRYESLVSDPAGTLQAICAFLGERYDPAMLDFQQLARQEGGGVDAHLEPQAALHRDSIGRWQSELTLFERKLAQTLAGPLLVELGYSHDTPPPLTTVDRTRMAWLSARFHLFDTLRTFLYQQRLLTLNRNRRRKRR